ncbi:VOC family protein [Phormidium tenue FACHB-886]|nr:VOC family protein [Phormidium tenue FACHB-886]
MVDNPNHSTATIIPTLRYKDAPAAIEWLCAAFGFEKHLVILGENGTIAHAQLIFGNGMIMVGSARDDEFGKVQQPPNGEATAVSQSPYIIVEDVDKHYTRAITTGAEVVIAIKDEDYGGRDYSCRDPEGFLWNFGTYNPWNAA